MHELCAQFLRQKLDMETIIVNIKCVLIINDVDIPQANRRDHALLSI